MNNRQALIASPDRLEVVDKPIPRLQNADEILVRTAACGICSGDLMPWYLQRKTGTVLGHEVVGWAVEVGPAIGGDGGVSLDPAATLNRTVVSFIDEASVINELPYSVQWTVGDDDQVLERGEIATMLIDVSGITPALTSGRTFLLEVRPSTGAYISVRRTMPYGTFLDTVVNLR